VFVATIAMKRMTVCGPAVIGVLSLPLLAGCDLTGQYEANFQKALQTSTQRAVFDLNLHQNFTEVVDPDRKNVGVKLRIPKFFDNNSKSISAADLKGSAAVAIPGLSYAIERQLDDQVGQWLPAYVYFAAIPKADMKADALQAALAQVAATLVPGAAWSDVQVATPDGKQLTLKRLQASGQQPFMDQQKKAAAKVDGRFDLYYVDGGNHHVLIAWRAPKAQGDKYQFEAATQAAMGTLEITEPPAPPAKGGAAAPKSGCA
jgi:hypothetical protein